MKATDYKTVCFENVHEFDKEIRRLLHQGWELYGSPYGTNEFSNQAMIKPKKPDAKEHPHKHEEAEE